jgi:MEMO1 family protein
MKGTVKVIAGITLSALLFSACGGDSRPSKPLPQQAPTPAGAAKPAESNLRVRIPAVAGLFYPAEEQTLAKTIEELLKQAPEHHVPGLRALICPHAGYAYSGPTAASAYKTLARRDIQTVIILAASHYAAFQGASVPNVDAYQTPLGTVPISEKAQQLLKTSVFVLEPRCSVQRPGWWRQASKSAPTAGEDTPETWEHSVEVQIPFLQKVLKEFKILPVVFGDADPEQVAKTLAVILDDKTVVLASSDLSHYHSYDDAKKLDGRCVKAICDLNVDEMKDLEACGKLPILTLMHLAKLRNWTTRLLDCRNSGDTSGEKNRVVGYTAIAFCESAQETYAAAERIFLLDLARQTLKSIAAGDKLPGVNASDLPAKLKETKSCFVTLTKAGSLRGCIGHIQPQEALYQAVIHNAQRAALHDPRFPPVHGDEADQIKIEVSVLTEPQPLSFNSPEDLLNKLQSHQDGVVLRIGTHSSTFLPQVWQQIPDKVDFLNRLAQKAGCEPSDWRGKETTVLTYRVEAFHESE